VTGQGDGARMAAGIASIAAHERAQQAAARLDAERAATRPAPPEITGRPGRDARIAAEKVRCPFCKASPGQPCRRGLKVLQPHPSRVETAAVVAVAERAAAEQAAGGGVL